jgi:hypothetical protein
MNKLSTIITTVLFIFITSTVSCEQRQNSVYPRNPIVEGFIIRENVNFHAGADRNSAVLGILGIHDRIEILANIRIGNDDNIFSDRNQFWHKIKYNGIEGYILQGNVCTDRQIFDINGNTIVVYREFANSLSCPIPGCLVYHSKEYTIFINDKTIVLPNFISSRPRFNKSEIIDGNLHLNYNHETYDEMLIRLDSRSANFWRESPSRHYDYRFIIKPQDDGLYIVQVNNRRYDKFIITDRISNRGNNVLEFAGVYNVAGQHTEGDFTIEENGEVVAYRGADRRGMEIIIPETIAGITVISMDRGLFGYYSRNRTIRLPPSIRFYFGDFGNSFTIIIDSDVNIWWPLNFVDFYNSNEKKGGRYNYGFNNDSRRYEWSFEPF